MDAAISLSTRMASPPPPRTSTKSSATPTTVPLYEQYKAYSDAYLADQDNGFKSDFCKAYRAMGTIGLIAPAEYFDDAAGVIISA